MGNITHILRLEISSSARELMQKAFMVLKMLLKGRLSMLIQVQT